MIATKPPITSATVLLLCSASDRGGSRETRVRAALDRAGLQVQTLGEVLDWQPRGRRGHFIPERSVTWALRQVGRVVVLPRPDSSIGAGTLRDLRLAESLGLVVYVVRQDGKLLALAEAGLMANGTDTKANAAAFTWSP